MRTCLYVYIYMCVCICTSMRLCTCVCVCVCMFVHRLWVLVSVLQRVAVSCMYMCFRVHMHAYANVCRPVYMYVHFFVVSVTCTLQVLGTSAWAGVYVTQVCFYTNVHTCEHTRSRLCTCVCASMILLDTLRRCY